MKILQVQGRFSEYTLAKGRGIVVLSSALLGGSEGSILPHSCRGWRKWVEQLQPKRSGGKWAWQWGKTAGWVDKMGG